jgi:hypothetical protein
VGLGKLDHLVFVSVTSLVGLGKVPATVRLIAITYSVECNVGIVAACLPCLKPLFKRILESSLGYGSSGKKDTYKLRSHSHGEGSRGSQYLRSQSPHRAKGRNAVRVNPLDDNISEESILSLQQPHAITKTTVVTIDRADSDARYGANGLGWSEIGFKGQCMDDRM